MRHLLEPWLNTVCGMIPNVRIAAVFLPEEDALPIVWPTGSTPALELQSLAETAVTQNAPVFVDKQSKSQLAVAYPLVVNKKALGVLTVLLDASSKQQEVITQLLNWSLSWLALLDEKRSIQQDSKGDLPPVLVKVLSTPKENIPTTLVSLVADYFDSARVSLGVNHQNGVRVLAMSHQLSFDSKVNLVSLIESAMDETLTQSRTLVIGKENKSALIAHEVLRNHLNCEQICSIPLLANDNAMGVLTLQMDSPIRDEALAKLEDLCASLAPIIALQQSAMPGRVGRALERFSSYQASLLGPKFTKAKGWSLAIVVFLIAIFALDGDFEVTAKATLEGKTQLAIVTPFDGYIASASARAGDVVEKDALLAAMDDKDLQFDLKKLEDNIEELTGQYRQALSEMNQSDVRILKSRVDQVVAQKQITEHRLQQVELRTPIAGVVLSGDLSRLVGAPIEKGEVLFEIAPLESYQILLFIEESDIQEVQAGLLGEVVLAAHPNQNIPFVVDRISSVMDQDASSGVLFRVEASIQGDYAFLRPGMEGVAKVSIGERSFAWILFRDVIHWLQLTRWRWLP